jgi:cobaltochelatase CobN
MVETYTDLASKYDIVSNNARFTDYINEQAAGFGLVQLARPDVSSSSSTLSSKQPVRGQKLEQVQTQISEQSNWFFWMFILVMSGLGVAHTWLERQPTENNRLQQL